MSPKDDQSLIEPTATLNGKQGIYGIIPTATAFDPRPWQPKNDHPNWQSKLMAGIPWGTSNHTPTGATDGPMTCIAQPAGAFCKRRLSRLPRSTVCKHRTKSCQQQVVLAFSSVVLLGFFARDTTTHGKNCRMTKLT